MPFEGIGNKVRYKIEYEKDVAQVTCSGCGESCTPEHWMNSEYMILHAGWGYDSDHDLEQWDAELCQRCAEAVQKFIREDLGGEIRVTDYSLPLRIENRPELWDWKVPTPEEIDAMIAARPPTLENVGEIEITVEDIHKAIAESDIGDNCFKLIQMHWVLEEKMNKTILSGDIIEDILLRDQRLVRLSDGYSYMILPEGKFRYFTK